MSIHDQLSREPPEKSCCIIRNWISSAYKEDDIQPNEEATAVADVDCATKEAGKK